MTRGFLYGAWAKLRGLVVSSVNAFLTLWGALVDGSLRAVDAFAAPFLAKAKAGTDDRDGDGRPGDDRDHDFGWWVPVAAGALLLFVSSVAMRTLGGQLTMMHLPGTEGFDVQQLSTSHLPKAVAAWLNFWRAGADELGMASPREVAITWILVDLLLFIPGYALMGSRLFLRAARKPRPDGLHHVLRSAASVLVLLVVFDVGENVFSWVTISRLWAGQEGTYLATITGAFTIAKTLVGVLVVIAAILLGLSTWSGRSPHARATGSLLRGQIGIAIATVAFFNLPIQLPDVFLSLDRGEFVWLLVTSLLLAVTTWATARWMVVRHEERPSGAGGPARAVLGAVVTGLVVLALVNEAMDGDWKGPLIPVALGVLVALLGAPLEKTPPADHETELYGPGIGVPHVLAAVGAAVAGGAAITAACLLGVADDRLGLLTAISVGATLVWVIAVSAVAFALERRLSGPAGELRPWRADRAVAPETVTDERRGHRSRGLGFAVLACAVLTAGAAYWLLYERVERAQSMGAASAVILSLSAFTLVLGALALAGDAWERRAGMPPAIVVMRFRRIPVFVGLLVWGLVASSLDDGHHWDVRTILGDKEPGISLDAAFADWTEASGAATEGGEAIPLVFVATSGGGIRSAYWTALTLDCLFAGTTAERWGGDSPCPDTGIDPPGPEDVFLASGISGGSLGLVSWDAKLDAGEDAGWVDEKLGEDFVAPTVAWGLLVEIPRSFLQFEADDRAEVLEESWEATWAGGKSNEMKQGFLGSQVEEEREGPLLLLNGSSVFDGCALNVSLLDAGATGDVGPGLPVGDCKSSGRYLDPGSSEEPGPLPATADLLDYLQCGTKHDVRRSTAALLSARFPYVSSAGRLAACDDDKSTRFILDGGIVDTSAAENALAVYLGIEDAIEEHNALPGASCVVPYFVQIDNGYALSATPRDVKPPNQMVAPLLGLSNTTGLGSRADRARSYAAELFTRPFSTVPGREPTITDPRYASIVPTSHPGVEAPLGWTLSDASREDLMRELYVTNEDAITTVKEWFTDPPEC